MDIIDILKEYKLLYEQLHELNRKIFSITHDDSNSLLFDKYYVTMKDYGFKVHPNGLKLIPLSELGKIEKITGASFVETEKGNHYIFKWISDKEKEWVFEGKLPFTEDNND